MNIDREFDGEVWRHWMNHPGEKEAKLFQSIAAKHGVDVLINTECYDCLGRVHKDSVAYWLKPIGHIDLNDIWDEYRRELRAHSL